MYIKKLSRILSIPLIISIMFSLVSLSVFAESSEPQLNFIFEADKNTVATEDIVTFTVKVSGSPSAKSTGWQFALSIPEGLTYISDSGKLNPDLKENIGASDECSFTESSLMVIVVSINGLKNLNRENEIMTFKCKVDNLSYSPFHVETKNLVVIDEYFNEMPDSKYLSTGVTLNAQYSSFSITGAITSFSNATESKIELVKKGDATASYTASVSDNISEYSFENIESGNYSIFVSKKSHVTRVYEISATDKDIELDLEIRLLGDVTGDNKANTIDVSQANAHAKGVRALAGYDFDCADVNKDGKVNTIDVAFINAHAKGVKSLW